jgi:hypothetical protein
MTTGCGSALEATGLIVGGWDDGRSVGSYGVRVWVRRFDLERIGVSPASVERTHAPARPTTRGASGTRQLDTGFTEAWATDEADDSYDLSWYIGLPEADRPAIAQLRELLAHDPDPIDRHFQFAELERRLYHARALYETALDEYDTACVAHDAEIMGMRAAFMAKWGMVPRLELYRQAAIRKAKQRDWEAVLYWAERGLAVYGDDAAREAAVEDLVKRRNQARAKLGLSATSDSETLTDDVAHARKPVELVGAASDVDGADPRVAVDEPVAQLRLEVAAVDARAPAAWYPDPTGRFDHRYWNGEQWTGHVARAGVEFSDPI